MKEALLDAFIDSLLVFIVVLIIYILLTFIENKIAHIFKKDSKLAPLYGACAGLIPQCGLSVVASDLYLKEHITTGTILAVFIACSDEAIPIMLADSKSIKMVLPLLAIKLVVAFIVGFLADFILHRKDVEKHLEECHHKDEVHTGCCHHHIDDEKENPLHKHLIHPLLHSLKIFAYVLLVNLLFNIVIYYVGENTIIEFLESNKYITPLLSSIVGIIPNCASSVIITELYVYGGISFGAAISGLIMNAGLGMVILLKSKANWKKTLRIFLIMIITSLLVGYGCCLIFGF